MGWVIGIDGTGTLQALFQPDVPQYSAVGVFEIGVAITRYWRRPERSGPFGWFPDECPLSQA